ncbi:hypothetical protein LP7551_04394 [Roseibium album]|jgi:hypothetical protein|nr:hypothetical protein LP7551_04394 [Roseibium album]
MSSENEEQKNEKFIRIILQGLVFLFAAFVAYLLERFLPEHFSDFLPGVVFVLLCTFAIWKFR